MPQKQKLSMKEEVRIIIGMSEPLTYSDFEILGRENNYSDETIKRNWLLYPLVNGEEVTNGQ